MKSKIISKPVRTSELVFEDFYLEISDAWERRAKELQRRRWSKIRQQEKESVHHDRRSTR